MFRCYYFFFYLFIKKVKEEKRDVGHKNLFYVINCVSMALLLGSLRRYEGCCIKMKLCVGLSVLRLFHVCHFARNRRCALTFV